MTKAAWGGGEAFNLGFMAPDGSRVRDYHNVGMAKGRHCAEAVTESLHDDERELTGNGVDF